MISAAILKAVQIYGIAIVISLIVAVLIRVLVKLTAPRKRAAPEQIASKEAARPQAAPATAKSGGAGQSAHSGTPEEVVAAISGALAVIIGPHKILNITRSDGGHAG